MSIQVPNPRALVGGSRLAAVWAFCYGLYRLYYAAGGTFAMLGTPASHEQWLRINAIAGVLLLVFAVLPIVLLNAWSSRRARPWLLALCWVVAVGCVSHAVIGVAMRVSSLTGALTIDYPFWETIDQREADLQALLFNEPWFLIEGLLWAAIAWHGALRDTPRRSWWLGSAVAAAVVSIVTGLLSAFGVIGRVIVG